MADSVGMFNLESSSVPFNPPSPISTDSSNDPNPQNKVDRDFQFIELPGENYFPVSSLVTKVIARYQADYSEYDAESWATYVLEKGNTFSGCKGVASYSAINSGSTGGKYWFGYAYSISLNPYNFKEKADVEGARAYRDRDFQAVVLPGGDYVPNSALLVKIMADYHADSSQYDANSWANHVLEQGKTLSGCKGVVSYSAVDSGGRHWFGYAFRTTVSPDEFELKDGVEGARAYGDRVFHLVDLPGDDYISGPTLFPRKVIAGYSDKYSKYDADSWTRHMLVQGQSYFACTVVSSFSAINSGNTGGRCWFGYVYRGGPVGPDAFKRGPKVQYAHAYSV